MGIESTQLCNWKDCMVQRCEALKSYIVGEFSNLFQEGGIDCILTVNSHILMQS